MQPVRWPRRFARGRGTNHATGPGACREAQRPSPPPKGGIDALSRASPDRAHGGEAHHLYGGPPRRRRARRRPGRAGPEPGSIARKEEPTELLVKSPGSSHLHPMTMSPRIARGQRRRMKGPIQWSRRRIEALHARVLLLLHGRHELLAGCARATVHHAVASG
jgi:hypothetical protein